MKDITVGDIDRAIATRFPKERAESWDRVGLAAGDADSAVSGVVIALDSTRMPIRRAVELGANVVVTHHPPFLDAPHVVRPGPGPEGVLYEALINRIALINAHTNLDRDAESQMLMVNALGLEPEGPLESSLQPMKSITVFVPPDARVAVEEALTAAGAGSIGDYTGCSFRGTGVGSFTPGPSSSPFSGSQGERSQEDEERVEMIVAPHLAVSAAAAAASAHPYEEPLVVVSDVTIARNAARLGYIASAPGDMTLGGLTALASSTYGVVGRAFGDPERTIRRVATATGSGTSLLPDAKAAGVDVIIMGEVRYHDALEAAETGLAVIELGHDVTEWPMMSLVERVIRDIPGIDAETVHLLPSRPAWWTS